MNVNSMINKCLLALVQKGKYYKYNTFKFYSEETGRYSTKHQLLKKKMVRTKYGRMEKYQEVKASYTNKDILNYLVKELKEMG